MAKRKGNLCYVVDFFGSIGYNKKSSEGKAPRGFVVDEQFLRRWGCSFFHQPSKAEIDDLGDLLIDGALAKMYNAAKGVLNAADVDITAIIKGTGEALSAKMK